MSGNAEPQPAFAQWAVVEIMGHQKFAGRVTEQRVGSASFIRVDVPETERLPGFTKMFGASAIFAITVVDERLARECATAWAQPPIPHPITLSLSHMRRQDQIDEFAGDEDL